MKATKNLRKQSSDVKLTKMTIQLVIKGVHMQLNGSNFMSDPSALPTWKI
jgi:hypothetical protein